MVGSMEHPTLHVEGRDDLHSIVNLMRHHGIDFDMKPFPKNNPVFKEIGSVEKLLSGIETAVAAASGNVVGFVLDADRPIQNRWKAVRSRLARVDVSTPNLPPKKGFIGVSGRFKTRVGVWLMPDNEHDGSLENFLHELIGENDILIDHAQNATHQARSLGAAFSDPDAVKAVIYAWLAWQKEPGFPFGKALRARFLMHDRPAGMRFAKWFKSLYDLSSSNLV